MLKAEKEEFVKRLSAEIKARKSVGIMPMAGAPDRLFQKIRNGLKPSTMVIVARKSIISRALDGAGISTLMPYVSGNAALVLSDIEPFELYKAISSNRLRLLAKPNQISNESISIEAGETSIAPGQAVTDLKAAGIDVQIQKGKVIISKGKVLVEKNGKISAALAKALKMLDILPFEARGRISALLYEGTLFSEEALSIDAAYVTSKLLQDFTAANMLSTAIGLVTPYNAAEFISKAFSQSVALGLEAEIYEDEVVKAMLGIASLQASALNSYVKE